MAYWKKLLTAWFTNQIHLQTTVVSKCLGSNICRLGWQEQANKEQ